MSPSSSPRPPHSSNPFLSRPNTPPDPSAVLPTTSQHQDVPLDESLQALALANVEADNNDDNGLPRSNMDIGARSSTEQQSGDARMSVMQRHLQNTYAPVHASASGIAPRSDSFGLGNHSLMHMINALGTDNDETEHAQAEDRSVSPVEQEATAEESSMHKHAQAHAERRNASSEEDDVPELKKLHESSQSSRPVFNKMTSSIHAIYAGMDGPAGHDDDEDEEDDASGSRYDGSSPLRASPKQYTSSSSQFMQLPPIAESSNLSKTPTPAQPFPSQVSPSNRRATLAEKLREIFNLEAVEEVLAEYPCWLYRSIMLQGFLYLTRGHLCFYAYLKHREGQATRTGSLSKRTGRARLYQKYWFILKDDVLSWFQSSTDPYFPIGQIDLHYVTSIEPPTKQSNHFKIVTPQKRYHFAAETEVSRQEWMRVLKKAVFKAQNEGESVKIAIPLERILSANLTESLEFAKYTMQVIVQDDENAEGAAGEEFYWSLFKNPEEALEQIRSAADNARKAILIRTQSGPDRGIGHPPPLIDSTSSIRQHTAHSPIHDEDSPKHGRRHSSISTIAAKLNPLALGKIYSHEEAKSGETGKAHPAEDAITRTSSAGTLRQLHAYPMDASIASIANTTSPSDSLLMSGYTYPPDTLEGGSSSHRLDSQSSNKAAGWGLSHWIPSNPKKLLAMPGNLHFPNMLPFTQRKVSETVQSPERPLQQHYRSESAGDDLAELPSKDSIAEFRLHFSLPSEESVLARHHVYLCRALPVYGILYVTDSYVCFRSTTIVFKTKMILPVRQLIGVQKARAYHPGFSGMILVVSGHEEVFFEFGDVRKRDLVKDCCEARLEQYRNSISSADVSMEHTTEEEQAAALKALELSVKSPIFSEPKSEELSPIMFNSSTSSFVTFKPKKPLHITCLTIGSRGDVQPYIALCIGLKKDGHHCRIASHAEYKEWIEGYGIGFSAVGGDPAELMKICVDNGMFTVSFLREGVAKFRGWLDELLSSAWTACQGTDLLIESPSTMAGCHIAEALQIPFFRAFTMPWTRTRAYPHAFAVPDVHMGGSYNYMTYTIFDQVFWRATAGQINRWRKKELDLPPTSYEKLDVHKAPFLYNFSPSVVPPPLDWMEFVHVTGYWYLENADTASKDWHAPAELLEFIDDTRNKGKKLVYIGFGSIVVSDPDGLTHTILEAIAQADVHAIVSKGWSDRFSDKSKKVPSMSRPGVFEVPSIPHDWLFPRVDAVCHHGGAGTTGASLRAGKPTIIRPFFGDQAFWADRVEALRVGVALKKLTVQSLAEALHECTTSELFVKSAERLGQKIRQEDGVANAIEAIYRDYEYAQSLIKRPSKLTHRALIEEVPKSLKRTAHEGAMSDDSSSWDMLSERTSSGAAHSEDDDSYSDAFRSPRMPME